MLTLVVPIVYEKTNFISFEQNTCERWIWWHSLGSFCGPRGECCSAGGDRGDGGGEGEAQAGHLEGNPGEASGSTSRKGRNGKIKVKYFPYKELNNY